MLRHVIYTCLLSFVFFSCKKPENINTDNGCTINCEAQSLSPVLTGFDSLETDTISVAYFQPNNIFNKLVKENVFTAAHGNTDAVSKQVAITAEYNYMVILPGVDTFYINDISGVATTGIGKRNSAGDCEGKCMYPLSVSVNGNKIPPVDGRLQLELKK